MAQVTNGPLSTLLESYKKQEVERGENVHPLVRDPILRNLIVIWPLLPVQFEMPKGDTPEDENQRWLWLWQGVKYDVAQLSEGLKLDKVKLARVVERASMFRLLYPDGTANKLATQYVRSEIAKSLQKKPGPKTDS